MTRLHVISDTLHGNTFDLSADYITIGRAADNTICLAHASVSKHHATLAVDGSDFKLCDLHSTNGTIVNGDTVVCTHLKDGDRITLGDVELRFALAEKSRAPSTSSIVSATTASPGPLRLIEKEEPVVQIVASALPQPKSNGDTHESNNDSPRSSPVLARVKGFAATSSRILSRLPFHRRDSQTSSPGNDKVPPPVVSTARAKATPIPIESGVIKPPVVDPPPKTEPDRPIPASSSTAPLFFAAPGLLAGGGKKEPALILKPRAPDGPIEIKKPIPLPQKEPLPVTDQPEAAPKAVLPTGQPRRPVPRKVAGASFYVAMTSIGLILLIVGYAGESNALKFLGLVTLTTGFLGLLVFLRNGSIIAPPKRRL
jgi:pSer/pThr/pTyr-binding forkhead associated (FHA) protein